MRVIGSFAAVALAANLAHAAKPKAPAPAPAPAPVEPAKPAEPPKFFRVSMGTIHDEAAVGEATLQAVQQAVASVMGATTAKAGEAGTAPVGDVAVDGKVKTAESGAKALWLIMFKAPDGATFAEVERPITPENAAFVAAHAAQELVARAAHDDIAELGITSQPDGASVQLDGEALGNTPVARLYVKPGEHKIHLEKEDFTAAERTITLASGDAKDEAVTLAESPEAVARREAEKARLEAEAKAKAEAKKKAEEEARRRAEEERARIEAIEAQARAAAEKKRAEEEAIRQAELARRDLFGAFFRVGYAVPNADARAGLDALNIGGGDRMVYGGTLRAPVYRNHFVAFDLDYWRDNYWPQDPPTGTPKLVRVLPVGMLQMGLSGGRRERFADVFFVDGTVSLGARLTRYAKHQEFQGGEPLDELEKHWKPAAGLGLAAGVVWNHVEASLGWKLSFPLGSEPAAASLGGEPSIGGFGLTNLFSLLVGAVY